MPVSQPAPSPATQELLANLNQGCPDAMGTLASDLHNQIVRTVRAKRQGNLKQCMDTEDLVQDVWATVLSRIDNLPAFGTRDEVVKYLARIAGRQVTKQRRKFFADKRDVRRNVSFEENSHTERPQATPSRELMAADRTGMSAEESHVLDLRLCGYSKTEIAEMLGTNETKIRRVLRTIARKQAQADDEPTECKH